MNRGEEAKSRAKQKSRFRTGPPEVACRCTVRFFQDIQVKESMLKGFQRILKKVLVE